MISTPLLNLVISSPAHKGNQHKNDQGEKSA